MRMLFALESPAIPAALVEKYGDIEAVGTVRSYSDAIRITQGTPTGQPVEVLIASDALTDAGDRSANITLDRLLMTVKAANPSARLVILSARGELTSSAADMGAIAVQIADPLRASDSIGEVLNLAPRAEIARVITIAGLQGGAGRTTVARMLAEAFGERFRPRPGQKGVLLWEMDFKHPTLAYGLGIDAIGGTDDGRRTISGLLNAESIERDADPRALAPFIVGADASKRPYDILIAPHGIRSVIGFYKSNSHLSELRERIRTIMEVVRRSYAAVIIDTGTDFFYDPGPAVAIGAADAICLVATPCAGGVSSVHAARQVLGDFRALERTRLIVNRVASGGPQAPYIDEMRNAAGGIPLSAPVLREGGHLEASPFREIAANIAGAWIPTRR
jgi:MinD-like ATPase involved in chromosome partitioning or flagellar assembly